MLSFQDSWLLVLLLLPAVLLVAGWRRRRNEASVLYPRLGPLGQPQPTLRVRLARLPWLLRLAALSVGILALARPQWGTHHEEVVTEGIDIMLALDVSLSMRAEDFRPDNRLAVARDVLHRFIEERPHDRLGLVVFAGKALTQCPLTLDHHLLGTIIDQVDFATITDEGTAIGMALGHALARLRRSDASSKVVVLVTDGVSNAGPIGPATAAEMAQMMGVRVYAIGVGTHGPVPFPVATDKGVSYRMETIPLDEEILAEIATLTGGTSFRATDAASLREALERIDSLEKTEIEVREYRSYEERFSGFAALALGLIGVELLLGATVLRRLP